MCLQPITGRPSEPDRLRPNVPITQSASIPVPICNGCGTTSDKLVLLPSTSVGKTGWKYGQLQLFYLLYVHVRRTQCQDVLIITSESPNQVLVAKMNT